jgi:peptidyl-dipeptidase Dcp
LAARASRSTEIVLWHRLPHFGHVFAGDGYSAGYYSYLWSDVITIGHSAAAIAGSRRSCESAGSRLSDAIFVEATQWCV